jgi:hypothetical protein
VVMRGLRWWLAGLSFRERVFLVIAIVGAVVGLVGGLTGAVALDRIAGERTARTADNALATYNGCRRANVQTRPATRIIGVTLRDLIRFINAGATEAELAAAQPFARAPARLDLAVSLLRRQPCSRQYPDGYAVWLERGKPPLVPPVARRP